MRRLGRVASVSVLLISAVVTTATTAIGDTGGANDAPAPGQSPSPELDQAIGVRRMLGLETDRGFVTDLLAAPADHLERSGIVVTAAEAAELDRRKAVSRWATSSAALLNADNSFAGSWTAPKTGVLHLAFVGPPRLPWSP